MSENNNNYNDDYYEYDSEQENIRPNKDKIEDIYSYSSKHQAESKKHTKHKNSAVRRIFSIILIIFLIIIIAFSAYGALVIFRIKYADSSPNSGSIESIVGELKSDSNIENIMIFGVDNHSEDENGRSDSMILLSADKNNNTLKMTSFLRDIYLTIPGYGKDRLNAAYSYGGASLAIETIEYNFGLKIDRYAIVDFESFTSIIDSLGGIDLELTAEEIDYINWQCWKNHQVKTRNELNIGDYTFLTDEDGYETAKVHLNGRQALWYARDRDSAGSDFDRTSRQRIVIDTVFSKLKSSDAITFMRIIYEIAPMVTTNLSKGEIVSLGINSVAYLNYDREEFRIPTSDNFSNTWVYESLVLTINDIELEKERLYKFIFNE